MNIFQKFKNFFEIKDKSTHIGHCAFLPREYNVKDDLGYYGRYKLISGKFRKYKGMLYPITDKVVLMYTKTPSEGSMHRGKTIYKVVLLKNYSGKNKLVKL